MGCYVSPNGTIQAYLEALGGADRDFEDLIVPSEFNARDCELGTTLVVDMITSPSSCKIKTWLVRV